MGSDWQQAQRTERAEWCARVSPFRPDLRQRWARSRVRTQQFSPTPMDDDAAGKGKGKGCFVCGRPGHVAKDWLNQCKGRAKGKEGARLTRKPAKFEGACRHCGKKGHKWADCRKRLAEAKDMKKVHAVGTDGTPSTATVAAVEDTGEIDEKVLARQRHRHFWSIG